MPAPRVVLDTNVLVSGLCFGGLPAKILQAALAGKIEVFTSAVLIDEFKAVMRLKFPNRERAIADTFNELSSLWEVVSAEARDRVCVIAEDPDDDRVLECALAAKADCIVSGDQHLLRLEQYRGVLILSPAQFFQRLK